MQNYHNHKSFSNTYASFKDSAMSYEDYAKRAVELHQQVITSVDHGTQGNYLRCWQTAKKYGLKFVYGVEAYWVRDRHEDDRTNGHIILLAQTLEGIYQINEILSDANEDGFYYTPRVDMELLGKLDPKDVFVTTACVAFWGKVDRETQELRWHYSNDNTPDAMLDIFAQLYDHFGSSLALEVQCHNTGWQRDVNEMCLKLNRQYRVPLIVGLDSHYINDRQKEERRYLREESGIKTKEEDYEFDRQVYEDYPDEETVRQRLREQGVLNEQQIQDAIDMTDTLLFFDDIEFDTSRKLPTIYPSLTQEERNRKYLDIIDKAWSEYKRNVPKERWREYEDSFMKEEVSMVIENNMSDYFLLDHEMVKLGKKMGGMITPSGRGSSGSWFTNTLLGFSTLDRFTLPVPLYPARFCTAERLKTSVPDLDLNLSDPSIFAQAQEKLMGKGHAYPMIAYGTLQYKSAFKMYARAQGIPADTANDVTKQIAEYELAYKEADEDERDTIDIADYVDRQYIHYIEESAPYRGIVVSKSQAPCAYMVYNGDIRREVGICRVNAKGGKKIVYCTVIDGYTAEEFGYVKNDLLAVKTIAQSAEAMKRAGLPQYTSKEIIELTKNDPETWKMLSKGFTQGINQCAGVGTTDKLRTYKPQSLQDLTAFVAAIRPGFKSMVSRFLHRDKFSYDIPSFDALLHNDSSGSSWLLYQEDIMKCLGLAGFPMEETYPIIKAISKKKAQVIESAKERFLEGFSKHIVETEKATEDKAKEVSAQVWQVIIDSSSYSFNAAHAVAVAIDALYGAYCKAHYPFAYYTTLLDDYAGTGNKEKVALIKDEMKKAFGISIVPAKFRQDNRSFFIDQEHRQISDALHSVKFVSQTVANQLYRMRENQYDSFVSLLVELDADRAFNSRTVEILIRMGYFEEFGEKEHLLAVFDEFQNGKIRWSKNYVDATKQKRLSLLKEYEKEDHRIPVSAEEQISFELIHYGTPLTTFPSERKRYAVLGVNDSYTPRIKLYSISTGRLGIVKIRKNDYLRNPLKEGDIITVNAHKERPAYTYSNGERHLRQGVMDIWVQDYSIDYREGKAV